MTAGNEPHTNSRPKAGPVCVTEIDVAEDMASHVDAHISPKEETGTFLKSPEYARGCTVERPPWDPFVTEEAETKPLKWNLFTGVDTDVVGAETPRIRVRETTRKNPILLPSIPFWSWGGTLLVLGRSASGLGEEVAFWSWER